MAKVKIDAFQLVTDLIISKLEEGKIPWKTPWNASDQMPTNLSTGKEYRGINIWVLKAMGFSSKYWLSFKQAKDLGGQVKKGEKSTPIVFWKMAKKAGEDGDPDKSFFFLKYWRVFNLDQIDGIEAPKDDTENADRMDEFSPIETAQLIIDKYQNPPKFRDAGEDGDQRAYYIPSQDIINIPKKERFNSPEHYYATCFHEMGHSTGHEKRLNRDEIVCPNKFGSHAYSKEELVAEFTASFLCATAEIDTTEVFENTTAYIQGWIKKLKDNPKYLVQASGRAQKAANHILNISEVVYD